MNKVLEQILKVPKLTMMKSNKKEQEIKEQNNKKINNYS